MMITPTKVGVYAPAPSRLAAPQEVSAETFASEYADTAQEMSVSFEPDGASNPQSVTAYYGHLIVSGSSD